MKIRLNVKVKGVGQPRDIVEVPDEIGYRVLRLGRGTQLPPYTPPTVELNEQQVAVLGRP